MEHLKRPLEEAARLAGELRGRLEDLLRRTQAAKAELQHAAGGEMEEEGATRIASGPPPLPPDATLPEEPELSFADFDEASSEGGNK